MLKISMFEFFFRGLPEAFLFVFAAFSFAKIKLDVKKYIVASMILAALAYLVRFLPIQYGVNTVLNLFVIIIIMNIFLKLDMTTAIRTGIIIIIVEFVCEAINIFFIQALFKIDINYVFNNAELKVEYGLPSLAIFALMVFSYYIAMKNKNLLSTININDSDV